MSDPIYDLVVIGGGSAGLTASIMGSHLGARVLLVERIALGGDCLRTGCVPSKALLAAARAAHDARSASALGVDVQGVTPDFARVMERVRAVQREIATHDSEDVLTSHGVAVAFGAARFVDPHRLRIADRTIEARRTIIATGASPMRPTISGLDADTSFDHETIWTLDRLPARMVVLGAGPVGCELGQAFARLGTEVTIVERAARILPSFAAEAAEIVARALERDGVRLLTSHETRAVEAAGSHRRVHAASGDESVTLDADAILVAAGRRANTTGLDLATAGVQVDDRGIVVDDALRTTAPHIFAAGDCAGGPQSTHWAEKEARVATRNALYAGVERVDRTRAPRVVFTDPELAEVGADAAVLARHGEELEEVRWPMSRLDRALCDGRSDGFVSLHVDPSGRIRHAVAVGHAAAELVPAWMLSIERGLTLRELGGVVHPYPTYARANRRAADELSLRRGAPRWASLFQRFIRRRRPKSETRRAAWSGRWAPVLRTATLTAILVGTTLNAINHGDALVHGLMPEHAWPLLLNYVVPFCVSSWSGAAALAASGRARGADGS